MKLPQALIILLFVVLAGNLSKCTPKQGILVLVITGAGWLRLLSAAQHHQ